MTLTETCGIRLEDEMDLIPHSAKLGEDLFLGSYGMGRIAEAPVVAPDLTGKHRANLLGVAADGNDRINRTVQKLLEVLRVVSAQIDADLPHDFDGFRMDISGGF